MISAVGALGQGKSSRSGRFASTSGIRLRIFPIGKMSALQRTSVRTVAELGAVVRRLRRAQGLTQVELGELALVGARFIGELERGKRSVQLDKVLAVLGAVGVDVQLQYPEPG